MKFYRRLISSAKPNRIALLIFIPFAFLFACSEVKTGTNDYNQYVNTLIGTAPFHDMQYMGENPMPGEDLYSPGTIPGVIFPKGMVVNPNTGYDGIWHMRATGYRNDDSTILGFSHLNRQYERFGYLPIMPTTGKLNVHIGDRNKPGDGYRSRWDRGTEKGEPGYYTVELTDYNIKAELTSTENVAFHKYSFPETDSAHILFNLGNLGLLPPLENTDSDFIQSQTPEQLYNLFANTRGKSVESKIEIVNETTLKAWQRVTKDGDSILYYHISLSKPYSDYGTWKNGVIVKRSKVTRGQEQGCYLSFTFAENENVVLKVAVSNISPQDAEQKLNDVKNIAFDKAKSNLQRKWNTLLSVIEVEGGSEAQKTNFYTSLYMTLTDDWYINWPLGTFDKLLLYPEDLLEQLKTDIIGLDPEGFWGAGNQPEIAAAYHAGIKDFDAVAAYESLRKAATDTISGWSRLKPYLKYGYIPTDEITTGPPVDLPSGRDAVNRTLGYAYSDFCIAQLAKMLGYEEDYSYFYERSKNYLNLYNPKSEFFHPKRTDGTWAEPFDPTKPYGQRFYREGTAWTYLWFVPHDVQGLINSVGGNEKFVKKLDQFFTIPFETEYPLRDVTGMLGQYCHGNEFDRHAPYLYNYAGSPWKTQKMVTKIMELFHLPRPDGLTGMEDRGMFSNWYILSAMGFYPQQPEIGVYLIGSPIFEKVTIQLSDYVYGGKKLVIEAKNVSKENIYIQNAQLNDSEYRKSWFKHEDIVNGAHFVFEMGPEPNPFWGKCEDCIPPSLSLPK